MALRTWPNDYWEYFQVWWLAKALEAGACHTHWKDSITRNGRWHQGGSVDSGIGLNLETQNLKITNKCTIHACLTLIKLNKYILVRSKLNFLLLFIIFIHFFVSPLFSLLTSFWIVFTLLLMYVFFGCIHTLAGRICWFWYRAKFRDPKFENHKRV